ncbi:MAG: hypothetical protein HZA53_11545 [Planctomycetes bacterium]|nr:hypothetical protein [Planctomycetota bacterium]
MKQSWTFLAAVLATSAASYAQTNFPETEANDTKAAANVVNCMNVGDTITGNTTGTSTTVPGAASADYYDVTVCTQAGGLNQYRLTITSAVVGHTGTIRGLSQAAGVPNAGTDLTLQTSSTLTLPPRYNQWYASGGAPSRIVYRVTGAAATTMDYVSTLSSTAITPVIVPGAFLPGPITVTTIAQGHTTDTELYVYDSSFNPVATFHNDDEGPAGPSLQSRATRTLAAGTYYVAISNFNTANSNGDANADEDFQTGTVLDFPNALANSSTTVALNVSCSISDGTTTTPVALTKVSQFDIAWACFTVGAPPLFAAFCAGDNLDPNVTTDCPCLNFGAAGRGCASSFNASGAGLAATGSVALDTVALNVDGVNASGNVIFMRGDVDNVVGLVFGDGVRCVDGVLRRRTKPIFAPGLASFPSPTDTVTLSNGWGVGNDTPPGSGITAYYMAYYRNASAAFCPPETFNGTNAWGITW